ncbi:hypothetical protein [Cognatiluteimonas weifangensis]|uniref:DUF4231 domain-containing protein n=1 Tax=Cognatiluteimonas weifangensis TaxID=2303539 RepID=A0A372DKX3_9GAMM|nr:hypothetical protein [Luteimonas weifangensis]RFP60154.1 hypothetical protein D0Y53_08980 [Luteimonas weifangensis]
MQGDGSSIGRNDSRQALAATALVVGVTSHRDLAPEQLPALRRQLREAFAGLRAQFPELQPVVLSPLAEGGDRLVAEAGLEQGARLIVPLPLPAATYARDFSGAQSRAQFERLLAQAETVALPLPAGEQAREALRGPGAARDRQYLLAGLYVASHCHVLFALWDGSDGGGVGGTAQIVRYYLGGPLPGARRASDNLRQMLSGDDDSLVLHLPVLRTSAPAPAAFDPRPCWLTSAGQRPLASGMPPDYRRIFERMQAFERDRLRYAVAAADAAPASDPAQAAAHVVDAMAIGFQRRTTAAMRAIHVLAVLMGLAFLLYSDLGAPDWMLWLFLAFFLVGLAVAVAARRRDWHRKYIDYRALAEGLRVQAFWRRAGLSMTGDPEFAHDNFMQKQDVELGWIRNVMRQIGLLPLPRSGDPAGALDAVIEDWVGRPGHSGQLAYYERKAELRARHHLRTQALGAACLWSGIGISLFLALFHRGLDDAARNLLVTAMGALSLIAAVREAYAYRKADKELVKQYRFMHRIYRNARAALDATADLHRRREILRALGEAALEEHAEWALMHRDRPIEHGRP